jgi:hypothetical protein
MNIFSKEMYRYIVLEQISSNDKYFDLYHGSGARKDFIDKKDWADIHWTRGKNVLKIIREEDEDNTILEFQHGDNLIAKFKPNIKGMKEIKLPEGYTLVSVVYLNESSEVGYIFQNGKFVEGLERTMRTWSLISCEEYCALALDKHFLSNREIKGKIIEFQFKKMPANQWIYDKLLE